VSESVNRLNVVSQQLIAIYVCQWRLYHI